jgi:uncharacterized phiE125 gp8 family phage protein
VPQYLSLNRNAGPSVEPVTVAEAKSHLRVDTSDDDTYIGTLITAAREWVEAYLDRTLVHTQWKMRLERFPTDSLYPIELPRPPVVSSGTATAVTITYTGETGNTATLSTAQYRVQRFETPGRVTTVYGGTWPAGREDNDAVQVTWWAGYGSTGSSVPAAIRHAILMLVGYWYENRSTVVVGSISKQLEFAVESLLSSQKWGSYA